jgi:hypothetical protein
MENQINLQDILNFLVNTKSTKKFNLPCINEVLDLNYLEFYNSKNFNYFNDIFNDHVDRIGISLNNKKHNSLYFSILYLLHKDYCLFDNDQQNYLIKVLKEKIKNDMLNRLFKPPKDLTKKKVINALKPNDNNALDVYILAAYFNINIYVFSYTTKDIQVFYNEDKLNIYKMNIFINEINNIYYPLSYKLDNGRYFKYNSTILNNTIFSNKISSYNTKNNKLYEISNSWEEILNKYLNIDMTNIIITNDNQINTLSKLEDSDDSDDSDIDINNLTEEINNIKNNINEIDSDNISLDSDVSSSNDSIKFEVQPVNSNLLELVSQINEFTDNKFKKLKKDELLDFIQKVTSKDITPLKKKNKDDLITNLKNEVNKFI